MRNYNSKQVFIIIVFMLMVTFPVFSQNSKSEVIKTINGREYYIHKVKKGETLYSISNLYNVSVDEIKANTGDVIRVGQILKIIKLDKNEKILPVYSKSKIIKIIDGKEYYIHKVKKGQTLYSISKLYNVPINEIDVNTNDALRVGQILKIIKLDKNEETNQYELENKEPELTENASINKIKEKNEQLNIEIAELKHIIENLKQTHDKDITELRNAIDTTNLNIKTFKQTEDAKKLENKEVQSQSDKKTNININGELRTRYEYRDGYKKPLTAEQFPANIIAQRSRLNFESSSDKLKTRISVQDVRVWGEVGVKKDIASVFLNEAWFDLKISKRFNLKIGRQAIKYDDQRLLSATNWNNVGTSHDLALLKYKNNSFNFHFGAAYNNDKNKTTESFYPIKNYKTLSYIWLSKKIKNFNLSFIDVLDGNQKDSSDYVIYARNTLGPNIIYKNKKINFTVFTNIYYQHGKDAKGNDIQAYFYSGKITKNIANKYSAAIALDYYSGTNGLDENNTTINTFNKLYGAGHKYGGFIDYFTNTYSQTKNGGLSDMYLKLSAKYNKFSSSIYAHYLSLANNVIDPSALNKVAINKYLGTEIDIVVNYKISNNAKIQTGYSIMLPSKSMEIIKGGNSELTAQWAYIMFTITPNFYKNE